MCREEEEGVSLSKLQGVKIPCMAKVIALYASLHDVINFSLQNIHVDLICAFSKVWSFPSSIKSYHVTCNTSLDIGLFAFLRSPTPDARTQRRHDEWRSTEEEEDKTGLTFGHSLAHMIMKGEQSISYTCAEHIYTLLLRPAASHVRDTYRGWSFIFFPSIFLS